MARRLTKVVADGVSSGVAAAIWVARMWIGVGELSDGVIESEENPDRDWYCLFFHIVILSNRLCVAQ